MGPVFLYGRAKGNFQAGSRQTLSVSVQRLVRTQIALHRTDGENRGAAGRVMIVLQRILAFFVTRLGYREIISDLLFLFCLAFAWFKPQFCGGFFDAVDRAGTRLAERKRLAIVLLAAAAILIRLSLLWLLPVPVPRIH